MQIRLTHSSKKFSYTNANSIVIESKRRILCVDCRYRGIVLKEFLIRNVSECHKYVDLKFFSRLRVGHNFRTFDSDCNFYEHKKPHILIKDRNRSFLLLETNGLI